MPIHQQLRSMECSVIETIAKDVRRRVWLPDVCLQRLPFFTVFIAFSLTVWLCLIPSFASWRREHSGVSCFADFGRFFEFLLD